MPTGIIINSLSIILGGIAGGLFGGGRRDDFKENLNLIFGLASMVMGISAIVNMVNMPAVIFAVVIGLPYFSSDTTASLRTAEIEADAILMAKKGVDRVYNDDPRKNAHAV